MLVEIDYLYVRAAEEVERKIARLEKAKELQRRHRIRYQIKIIDIQIIKPAITKQLKKKKLKQLKINQFLKPIKDDDYDIPCAQPVTEWYPQEKREEDYCDLDLLIHEAFEKIFNSNQV